MWDEVNEELIKKSLTELSFEEILYITEEGGAYKLTINEYISYAFQATKSIWNHLRVHGKVQRFENGLETSLNAQQFFIDIKDFINVTDITLSNFLEEINNTLYSDLKLKSIDISVDELSRKPDIEQQSYFRGHTKFLANKGRIGYSASDLAKYSPEANQTVQFRWILARKSLLNGLDLSEGIDWIIEQSFSNPEERGDLNTLIGSKINDYDLLPVHPWQWNNIILIQFQNEIQNEDIIDLGIRGDLYRPQTSLRTFSNITSPSKVDIKLPISILNTSSVRGLPQQYLQFTPELSNSFEKLINQDELLKDLNVSILREIKTIGVKHPYFNQVPDGAYRYQEYLGAVWRETAQMKGEAILTCALFHQDRTGKTLFESYLQTSGISATEWMKLYTKSVIIPLYHLQTKYGVGLVSHGQNIMLKLVDSKPAGVILKDFHGDLRVTNDSTIFNDYPLTKLPSHYLIHDLYTGHFITVLRFLSGVLHDRSIITESEFYGAIAEVIKDYSFEATKENNLLNEYFPKVLINKVRFHIGYGDNAQRPLPMLGSQIHNPLFLSLRKDHI